MNWKLAVEKNHEALKRILVMLVSMVQSGLGRSGEALFSRESAWERAVSSSPALTLPRHLHRFVLRLLRPAEAATRRLIIVAARGLVATPRNQGAVGTKSSKPILDRINDIGTGIVLRPKRSPGLSLPLLDPPKRFCVRRHYVKPDAMPHARLSGDDGSIDALSGRPEPVPPTRSADDILDAACLLRRLEAIGRALDDLPAQAKRFARWQARRDATLSMQEGEGVNAQETAVTNLPGGDRQASNSVPRCQRLKPPCPGDSPVWRSKPDHYVCEVPNELHGLAVWARDGPGRDLPSH